MNRKSLAAFVTACALGCFASGARAEKTVALKVKGAPLEIVSCSAEYDTDKDKAVTEHEVKYRNVGAVDVVSSRFGVIELNGFGEPLASFFGVSIEATDKGERDTAEFVREAPDAAEFRGHGTAIVWVDAVRFADGSLWKSDPEAVLEALRAVRSEATAADTRPAQTLVGR